MTTYRITPAASVRTTAFGDHAFDLDGPGTDALVVDPGAFLVAEGLDGAGALLAGTGAWTVAVKGSVVADQSSGIVLAAGNTEASTITAGDDDAFGFEGDAFGGLPAGALAADRFVANASGQATVLDQRFVYETDTGILRYDANGSAAGGVTVIADLTNTPLLTAADILIL